MRHMKNKLPDLGGKVRAFEEKDEVIIGVSKNNETVIGSASFRILNVN